MEAPVHLHPGDLRWYSWCGADEPTSATRIWAGRCVVHREHRGRGYGVKITRAGAAVLREMGDSSVVVAAEGANKGALATYPAAGFVPATPVVDMSRSDH